MYIKYTLRAITYYIMVKLQKRKNTTYKHKKNFMHKKIFQCISYARK